MKSFFAIWRPLVFEKISVNKRLVTSGTNKASNAPLCKTHCLSCGKYPPEDVMSLYGTPLTQYGLENAINDFVSEYIKEGVSYVICTDISKDGMLEGPAFDLYKKMILSNASQLKLIASGGISNINELPKLKSLGCEGVIIGKAIYENKISMKQLEQFIELNHA